MQGDQEPSPAIEEESQGGTGAATDEEDAQQPEGPQEQSEQEEEYWDEEDELEEYLNHRLEASGGEDSEHEAAHSRGKGRVQGGWRSCLAVA